MHIFNDHKMCADVCFAAYCLLAINQVKKLKISVTEYEAQDC